MKSGRNGGRLGRRLPTEDARRKEKEIAFRKDALERRLRSNLKDIPEYIRQNRVDKDEFFQTWGMMSGLWNTVDFERIRKSCASSALAPR